MTITQKIHHKSYKIKAWTIGKEKEALLESDKDDVISKVNHFYDKLIGADRTLSYQEKLYSLVDIKTKIGSDNINITYKCVNCKQQTEASVIISESISLSHEDKQVFHFEEFSVKLSYAEDLLDSIRCINDLNEMKTIYNQAEISEYVDSMDIHDYDILNYYFSLLRKPFEFNGKGSCLICGHEVKYSPEDEELINTITSISLLEYYPLIANLKSYGFLISELDNMMPFELELIISTLKKQNNNQGT